MGSRFELTRRGEQLSRDHAAPMIAPQHEGAHGRWPPCAARAVFAPNGIEQRGRKFIATVAVGKIAGILCAIWRDRSV